METVIERTPRQIALARVVERRQIVFCASIGRVGNGYQVLTECGVEGSVPEQALRPKSPVPHEQALAVLQKVIRSKLDQGFQAASAQPG